MVPDTIELLFDIQQELEAIFESNPPPLIPLTLPFYPISSQLTPNPEHLLTFYNKHLAPELTLRHVKYLPSLVQDLAINTNKAVAAALSTLPPLDHFRKAKQCQSEMNHAVWGGYGVGQFYSTIATFCRPVASTIALHPKAPGWNSMLVWTQPDDAIAGGFLRFLFPDREHDADRMPILESMERETREICGMLRASVSILATWEMRELAADSYEVMAAVLKLRKFTWTRCKSCLPTRKHDKCEQGDDFIPIWPDAKAPPWNLNGNSPITVPNSVRGRADISMLPPMPPGISPGPAKQHGITKPTSTAFMSPSLPRARPDASPIENKEKETGRKRKRSGNDGEYAAYKKGDIDTLPSMATPSEPYRPWKVTRSVTRLSQASASTSVPPPRAQRQISPTKNTKQEKYRQRKRNDDDDEAYEDPHDLTARSMVQQAWARAVRVDGTIVVLHSGNHEFVCVRHRKTQTLYISDLIEPSTCKDPGYVGLHVGIYIAAIQDAIDRKKQSLSLSPLPDEGKDSAGTSNDKDDRNDPRSSKDGSGGRRRPKTRNATTKNTIQAIDGYNAILLYLRYDVYNSPIPATFVRSVPSVLTDTQAQVSPQSVNSYRPADCLTITLTSEVGQGSTGVAHRGTLEVENSDGPGPLDVVVKLAFSGEQRNDLRSEYEVYRTLRSKGVVRGVATALGLFDDTDGDACALVMLYEGVSIREQVLSISDCKSALSILRSIHRAGILHGDIRRGNILKGDSGIVIIDFGRSRACDNQKAKDNEYARLRHLLEDSDSED